MSLYALAYGTVLGQKSTPEGYSHFLNNLVKPVHSRGDPLWSPFWLVVTLLASAFIPHFVL